MSVSETEVAATTHLPQPLAPTAGVAPMPAASAVVAVYETHETAEEAIRELDRSGFDMKRLSIVGKDFQTEQEVVGFYNTGDRMKAWGQRGAFWGGLWGMLFGSAFLLVPGIGPLFAAGPLVAWIVGALEGAVIVGGVSVLGAALYGLGIPTDSVIEYEAKIRAGHYLVIAHGPRSERDRMRTALALTPHAGLIEHL